MSLRHLFNYTILMAFCFLYISCKKSGPTPRERKKETFYVTGTSNWATVYTHSSSNEIIHNTDLSGGTWYFPSYNHVGQIHSCFRFDLSSIPSDAIIYSAYLSLYSSPAPTGIFGPDANSGTINNHRIYRIVSPWNGNTFASPGSTTDHFVDLPTTLSPFLDQIDLNVLQLVSAMKVGENHGFILVPQERQFFNIRQFCSPVYPDQSLRPKLVVEYQ